MIQTYRYGEPRGDDALRLGVARYAPRGISRGDYARKGYLDLWLPALAPTPELVKAYRSGKIDFRQFATRYRAEMKRPEPRQLIDLVAQLARERPVSLGCYCEDEARCHRSLLKALMLAANSAFENQSKRQAFLAGQFPGSFCQSAGRLPLKGESP
jgi:uncharacterized protein YeaO (DUF488 family)